MGEQKTTLPYQRNQDWKKVYKFKYIPTDNTTELMVQN